jgi:hypothetical protein
MAMHKTPKMLPGDWFASFKLPSRDGLYERFIVIHSADSAYDPFVVHTAAYYDEGEFKGQWVYSSGTYCRTLDRAQVVWMKAIRGYVNGVDVIIGASGSDA